MKKSPLHKKALALKKVKPGMRIAVLHFDGENVDFKRSNASFDVNAITVEKVVDGVVYGLSFIQHRTSLDAVEVGLLPDTDGHWSTRKCVVPFDVAKREIDGKKRIAFFQETAYRREMHTVGDMAYTGR